MFCSILNASIERASLLKKNEISIDAIYFNTHIVYVCTRMSSIHSCLFCEKDE